MAESLTLQEMRARLDALEAVDVTGHPDALESLHDALAAELDNLGAMESARAEPGTS